MNTLKHSALFFILFLVIFESDASILNSNFSMREYVATINMNFCQAGVILDSMSCKPKDWQRLYRSPVVGMDNRFDIWKRDTDGLIGVSLRGTTPRAISWMENFYSAMVPASGTMQIDDSTSFQYCFAEKDDAAVHVGWTYALGAMHVKLLEQIRAYYDLGNKEILIFGHSQGGALSYLTFSYFHYLQKHGKLPRDMRFKMVASASPKVGNIHFAYDFESYTLNSWAFNVINPEDWIPLMPFAVQTTEDMTTTQPFKFIKTGLKTQKLIPRIAIGSVYRNMDKKTKKARKSLQKNLGKRVGSRVKKERPQFIQPDFHHSMNYSRAGNAIVLTPDSSYYKRFPKASDDIFVHHMLAPYLHLAESNREKFND